MAKICLLTTGQPSSNPRIVKEADALWEAGHDVRVVCAYWADWADAADAEWLSDRPWRCQLVAGRPRVERATYWRSRIRHGLARRMLHWGSGSIWTEAVSLRALSRATPELISAAQVERSDLYIGHNLGALPAAVISARHHGTLAGFDAEDLHCAEKASGASSDSEQILTSQMERRYIVECDYVSASSPAISDSYAGRYGIDTPLTLLNVFPLVQQPTHREDDGGQVLRLYWFSQTIGPNRGLEDVVRAMGRSGCDNIELNLRGTWQAGYRDHLLGVADRSGVMRKSIVSHAPELPHEMPRQAARFDVGLSLEQPVSANKNLCLGNKIFTYMLAGNAIVATSTPAQSSLLESVGSAARIYPPGDVDALSGILRELHDDRELLAQARRSAWQAGRDTYNWDKEKNKLIGGVDRVLERRRP